MQKKISISILWFHLEEGLECSVWHEVVGEGMESKCEVVVGLKLESRGPMRDFLSLGQTNEMVRISNLRLSLHFGSSYRIFHKQGPTNIIFTN